MPPLDYPWTMKFLLYRFVNAHLLAGPVVALEFHYTCNLGKKRVITALAHVIAGMELCPALSYDDRTGVHKLAIETLYAEVLRIAISSIS